MKLCFLVWCAMHIVLSHTSAKEWIVKLNHGGKVLGSVMKSQSGREFYAFRGIPFAEPPTGHRRFQPPIPKASWRGSTLDATKDGPACVQIDPMQPVVTGQEDCLYINVYTSQIPDKDHTVNKKSVLVWIHGGGFYFGKATSDYFGPGRIMDNPNIILVTISYRFGALGFLSTGDYEAPGNYGMMDQALALKWVHENIDSFGGEAGRVTIFGESAGGASVGYHLLSPMSSGFFQNAISMSGSALCPWAFQEDPMFWAKKLAKSLKCTTKNSAKIVKCLRQMPAADIVQKTVEIMNKGLTTAIGFAPTIDGKFLQRSPRDIMNSGKIPNKVPLITGINKDEGLLFYTDITQRHPNADLQSKKVISQIISEIADSSGRSPKVGDLFVKKYLSSVDLRDVNKTRETVIKMITHVMFEMSHYETVDLRTKRSLETYAYRLEYDPSFGFNELMGSDLRGVGHADDLFLMFDGPLFGLLKPDCNDTKIIDVIHALWTNFAELGVPTYNTSNLLPIRWKSSKDGKFHVYQINNPITSTTFETSREDLYQFWINEVLKSIHSTKNKNKIEL